MHFRINIADFNSIKVRLEHRIREAFCDVDGDFNSIKVRLEQALKNLLNFT